MRALVSWFGCGDQKDNAEATISDSELGNAKDWINNGEDPGNARKWSLTRKTYTTIIVGGLAFTM